MGAIDGVDRRGKVVDRVVVDGVTGGHETPRPVGRVLEGSAGSQILAAGQVLIAGMRRTAGQGDPDRGMAFGRGAAAFAGAEQTVGSAFPGDEWAGGGARAYSEVNRRQSGRAETIATLDRDVQILLTREAHQIAYRRDRLDDQSDHLANLGSATCSIARLPGMGNAMRAAFELAAVTAALNTCSDELTALFDETSANATQLHGLIGQYSSLARKVAPPDPDDPPQPPSDELPPIGNGDTDVTPVDERRSAPSPPQPVVESMPVPPACRPESGQALAPTPMSETPTAPTAPAGVPSAPVDPISGMTSAFGMVGGLIGTMVAPLAAVLSGVAGTAGQALSALSAPNAAESVEPGTGSGRDDDGDAPDRDERRGRESDEPTADDPDGGSARADTVSPAAPADSAETAPRTPDRLEPNPPAATRPPQ